MENELKKKMEQLIKDNEELKNQLNLIQEGYIFFFFVDIVLLLEFACNKTFLNMN